MKLLDTSSMYCKIAIENDKKYIVKYPRECGVTREYYRSTPENELIESIQKNITVPKVLYYNNSYCVQEYVNGILLADLYDDHKSIAKDIIKQIVQQIISMTEIQTNKLLKYTNWQNNHDFYKFQCENTMKVFSDYYTKLKIIYDKLSISKEIMTIVLSKASFVHNNRKLSVIHGDIHKKNLMLKDNKIIFIDWELGCVGDLAYEIAFHLHQMAYTKSDEKYFMNTLVNQYKGDIKGLLEDIELYRLLILARSTLYHVYWTNLVYQSNNLMKQKVQLKHFMRRYNKLTKYKEFNLHPKKEEELETIFKTSNIASK